MSTVGCEHEFADVDRWVEIPSHLGKWSTMDYSIVNSDGHGNDPTGVSHQWGGEVNTVPTDTPGEQAAILVELLEHFRQTGHPAVVNWKCNLHVHVKPDLAWHEDVELLKRFASYLRAAEPYVWEVVDPLPKPTRADHVNPDDLAGAVKRWRRNLTSHHYSLPSARWGEMMEARTLQEFRDAHAAPTQAGGRAWHIAPRPGMNLRSLWKHGTVEFRHFFGTLDPDEVECAVRWCQLLTDAAVDHAVRDHWIEPETIAAAHGPWKFPRARPYDHRLQQLFDVTKWKK